MRRITRESAAKHSFEKGDRLLKRSDFQRLSKNGKRFQNRLFIAAIDTNEQNRCRLGITVTRKVGNAVTRNRIKRLARECFRKKRHCLEGNWDISLIAKHGLGEATNEHIVSALEQLFERISVHSED